MDTAALNNLKSYWETLRAGRIAPYRAELDPRKFEDALEHMFILEQMSPQQLRVRLAGMSLCQMMGMEVRGMPPEALMDAPHREMFQRQLTLVLNGPAIVELDLQAGDNRGNTTNGQMLLLPLRSDFGEVTRILGCLCMAEILPHPPMAFSIVAQRSFIVRAAPEVETATAMPGFAEVQENFRPDGMARLRSIACNPDVVQPSEDRPRGHLKLVGKSTPEG